MRWRQVFILLCMLAVQMLAGPSLRAQFRTEAFTQQYNDDAGSGTQKDTTEKLFSVKEYFGGLRHRNPLQLGTLAGGSAVFIGGCQIYNRDYWKLPIVYGTIGGALGAGVGLNASGNHKAARYCFIGAGVAYWATLFDGVVSYGPVEYPHAGKATLYSLLVPGLGQIYNGEYWKLPIYLGGMAFAVHMYVDNSRNFQRFRNIYLEAQEPGYSGPISSEQAVYYKNIYRRYRDYSLLGIAGVYLLQVIDANVFSYMHNFEIDDDISMKLSPTVFAPGSQLAMAGGPGFNPAFGLRLGLTF